LILFIRVIREKIFWYFLLWIILNVYHFFNFFLCIFIYNILILGILSFFGYAKMFIIFLLSQWSINCISQRFGHGTISFLDCSPIFDLCCTPDIANWVSSFHGGHLTSNNLSLSSTICAVVSVAWHPWPIIVHVSNFN